MTRYLTLEDLLSLIDDLQVGPLTDLGLLDSAAHRPMATLWGRDAYLTLDQKAAALLESLLRNHPLADGNKRLGWLWHARKRLRRRVRGRDERQFREWRGSSLPGD